ncbi:aldehyde dehydrogenase family protein [Streptomyces liliifuscus]|uniref:Aldehyde dehydrogenase family protein n=1 Tax=Streptomyces liliifuscus TaxID=2797636 RepID=A0A7T7L254_9ACTN|nr:aldehyde dehydrogenase family protein [Streptomyces liliifuscus]
MPIATVNPATGETLKTYDALGPEEIEHRLATAEAAFHTHRTTSFAERTQLLHRAADLLEGDAQDIARVMTTEMGKPIGGLRPRGFTGCPVAERNGTPDREIEGAATRPHRLAS